MPRALVSEAGPGGEGPMQFLRLTLPTLEENLALDEALLEEAEETGQGVETLRVWQSDQACVVLGRSSRVAQEVDQAAAAVYGLPVLRRVSGGASVVAGPGCLFYALLLSLQRRPELRMLDQAHRCVMLRMQAAMADLLPGVDWDGTCDLVLNHQKISGNSVRVARDWMLYHGTLLLHMDLELVEQVLRHPPREPEYRRGRRHGQFVTNCGLSADAVIAAWRMVWQAEQSRDTIPQARVARLVREKYSQASWNLQR